MKQTYSIHRVCLQHIFRRGDHSRFDGHGVCPDLFSSSQCSLNGINASSGETCHVDLRMRSSCLRSEFAADSRLELANDGWRRFDWQESKDSFGIAV